MFSNPFEGVRSPKMRSSRADMAGVVAGTHTAKIMKVLQSKTPYHKNQSPTDFYLSPEEHRLTDTLRISESLRTTESQILSAFFEKSVSVPRLLPEITPERIQAWEKLGLALHYLPAEDMTEHKGLSAWEEQPDYQLLDTSRLPPDIAVLKAGWVLVDTREKQNYDNGEQMYQNDFLGPVLAELRRKRVIKEYKHPSSRFCLSLVELEDPRVIAAFAEVYGLRPNQISLQRGIEFNVLGNIYYPGLGKGNTIEWFGDKYNADRRGLYGGDSSDGGLSYISLRDPNHHDDAVGFRLLGRLSS